MQQEDLKDIIPLYKNHNVYHQCSENDLVQHILPSLYLNQYNVFRYNETGVAYAFTNWAFLNDEAQEKFKKTGKLNKFDWGSGKHCWHIDTITNTDIKLKDIYNWTAHNFPKFLSEDDYVNWIRLDDTGQKVIKVNRIKVKDGVRKFKKVI